jgi:hypothetical protein
VFKNKSGWIVAAVVATLAVPMGAAMAASVDDVIGKYVIAVGGKDKIAEAKSIVKKGQFLLIDMGMSAVLESTKSGANFKYKIEIEGMGEITQAITGGTTWQLHFMEGDSVLEGDKAADVVQQSDDFFLMNWKNYFASAEVAGEADGDIKIVFKDKGDGGDTVAYFDQTSGLLHKMESTGPDGSPATLTFSEYKEVGGLQFSHKTEIAGAMSIEMTFDSIEVFTIPEVIKAQMPAEGITAAELMEQLDADGDGKVTMDEAPEQLQASFGMVDMDGSEGIDLEEMQLVADFVNNQ